MKKVEDVNGKREIRVSVDRVKYTLAKYQGGKGLLSELSFYFGSIITILITLCSATFNSVLGIPADIIKGVFIAFLVLFSVISLIKTFLFVFNKHKIKNEEEFIDELEYKNKVKTHEDYDKKNRIITFILMVFVTLLIIGVFLGLGFLFNWHAIYDIVGGISFLVSIMMWFSYWEDNFISIYNKLDSNKENTNG